jgi:flagellar hook-associated protein 3 FlgL
MQISTSLLFDRATSRMGALQNSLATSQAQLANGKQVIAPSDAPDQASTIARLKGIIEKQDSYLDTVNSVRNRHQAEETTLNGVTDSMFRMRELAIQAANDTVTPFDRQAIAIELDGLREQIMSYANVKNENGVYLFAGSRVTQPAFGMDAAGKFVYQGDQSQSSVLIGDQRTVQLNRSGSDAFQRVVRTDVNGDAYGVSFFQSLDDLVTAVKTSDRDGMNLGLGEIDGLQMGVGLVLAKIGSNMNVLDAQQVVLEETNLRLKTTLSGVEDLDFAEAITQMNKQMLSLEAAQSSFSQISQLNLFNYIK